MASRHQKPNSKSKVVIKEPAEAAAAPAEYPKHPLENDWSFWLFTNENRKNWLENLKELTQFNTVEDYWCLYHHTKLPSELRNGQDYAVFKKGISPMWEHEANKAGGRWLINIEKRGADLNRIWLDVVLLMIGENFESANAMVCGAVVNVRGRSKISIWTRSTEEKVNMVIGTKTKQQLRISAKLHFFSHDSTSVLYVC